MIDNFVQIKHILLSHLIPAFFAPKMIHIDQKGTEQRKVHDHIGHHKMVGNYRGSLDKLICTIWKR